MFTARQINLLVSAVAVRKNALTLLAETSKGERALPFQKQVEEYDAIIDVLLNTDRVIPGPEDTKPKSTVSK